MPQEKKTEEVKTPVKNNSKEHKMITTAHCDVKNDPLDASGTICEYNAGTVVVVDDEKSTKDYCCVNVFKKLGVDGYIRKNYLTDKE